MSCWPARLLMLVGAAIIVGCVAVGAAVAGAGATELSARDTVDVVGTGSIVWSHVGVRTRPTMDAPVLESFGQFLPDFRPRPVLAVRALRDADGSPVWYRISIPGRPNGRTGWVPAASVSLKPVDRWLVIFRGGRRFEFVMRGRIVRSGLVAVGAPSTPTPLGLFYVQAGFRPSDHPILGSYAFETSGYSKLSDWPGGGVVGVHGTNSPSLIGKAVSHGCVRLRNEDIEYLRTVVRAGTPIKIVAS